MRCVTVCTYFVQVEGSVNENERDMDKIKT